MHAKFQEVVHLFFQKESKRQCGTKTENVRPFESISVAEVKTQSCRTAAKFAKLFFLDSNSIEIRENTAILQKLLCKTISVGVKHLLKLQNRNRKLNIFKRML